MPDVTITIGTNEAKLIQKMANNNSMTPRAYLEQMVNTWATGQIYGYFLKKTKDLTIDELIAILGDIT